MTVLIAGATGFLGSRLLARLAEEGRDIIALHRVRSTQQRTADYARTYALQKQVKLTNTPTDTHFRATHGQAPRAPRTVHRGNTLTQLGPRAVNRARTR